MEKRPTPISRGVEIQEAEAKDIETCALGRYRELLAISKTVEGRIDAALAEPSPDLARLTDLFDQKHTVDAVGRDLEEIILRASEHRANLRERWLALEQRCNNLNKNQVPKR